ncbi:four-helix bundle copper-binding protein [Methanocella paludicola]|nr:four-helix bundle copper-binding protein [Methanocella paludicola]
MQVLKQDKYQSRICAGSCKACADECRKMMR